MIRLLAATFVAATALPGAAYAITVDGSRDAAYVKTASVSFDANAPLGNFGAPGTTNHTVGYDIYLAADASRVYGYFEATTAGTPAFKGGNLYFNIDTAHPPGSDFGLQIGVDGSGNSYSRAFVPNESVPVNVTGVSSFFSTDSRVYEFSIDNSLFTSAVPGITYDATTVLPTIGSTIQLSLSQSFGYSVAGGIANYGANRLGSVALGGSNAVGDVPEPATWGTMILGFALVGAAARGRRLRRALA